MSTLIEKMNENAKKILSNEQEQHLMICEIAREESLEALEHFLSKGYNINARNYRLKTFVHNSLFCSISLDFIKLLVSKGLNLHAIDVKGRTVLHYLFFAMDVEDKLQYLLENGVNPYQLDFIGEDPSLEGSFMSNEKKEIIDRYSQYSAEEISYEQALKDSDFPLAFSIIQRQIECLGGLKNVLSLVKADTIRELIKKLYNVLSLNKRHGEALTLIEVYLQELEVYGYTYDEFRPIGLAVPFVKGDGFVATRLISELRIVTEGFERDWIELYGLVLSSLMEDIDEDVIERMRSSAQVIATEGTYLSPFFDIALMDSENNQRTMLLNLSNDVKNYKYAFALGLIYLQLKDWLNAEYMFTKTIQMIPEEISHVPQVVIESHLLLDYIQQKKED